MDIKGTASSLQKMLSTMAKLPTATKKTTAKKTTAKNTTTKKTTTKPATKPKTDSLSTLTNKVKTGDVSGDAIINQFKDKIPAEQMNMIKLQQALEQRNQAVNMVTNLLRTMHEMAMAVIRNFRVA